MSGKTINNARAQSVIARPVLTGLFALALTGSAVGQEDKSQDVFLPDLGIIIDFREGSTSTADILLEKQSASAAYMESTRELRTLLEELSAKITGLESSLDEDMSAMRLENGRLRSLIQRLQADREKERTQRAAQLAEPADPAPARFAAGPEPAIATRPAGGSVRLSDIMAAYLSGDYAAVASLCENMDATILPPGQATQLAYWSADAHFRLGEFDAALLSLGAIVNNKHELWDDAIVLKGLVYLKLGRADQARGQFEAILNHYPASDYYRLAELTVRELHAL